LTTSSVGDKTPDSERRWTSVSILWILLIVILVLALLGFFSRGYW
jgi:flagellar basal body-associated protein FliL